MRRQRPVLMAVLFLAAGALGCEGPAGPAGPQGEQGERGPAGPAGQSALNTCSDCHTADATLLAIELQYANSVHGTTLTFEREGACARCHNHQGFVAWITDGTANLDVENPAPINCRTCHNIHETYTDADYGLMTTAPVTLAFPYGAEVNIGGDGNLCVQCHQARTPSVVPVLNGADVQITDARYGTHYGTQGNVMGAKGLYEFSGSMAYDYANPHATAGCSTCHMAEPYGAQSGGHTWKMAYDYHGSSNELVTGCLGSGCHVAVKEFDYRGEQTLTQERMNALRDLLIAQGILAGEDAHYATPGTYKANVVAAYLNWFIIDNDGSLGIHSPYYLDAVLVNTIEAMEAITSSAVAE